MRCRDARQRKPAVLTLLEGSFHLASLRPGRGGSERSGMTKGFALLAFRHLHSSSTTFHEQRGVLHVHHTTFRWLSTMRRSSSRRLVGSVVAHPATATTSAQPPAPQALPSSLTHFHGLSLLLLKLPPLHIDREQPCPRSSCMAETVVRTLLPVVRNFTFVPKGTKSTCVPSALQMHSASVKTVLLKNRGLIRRADERQIIAKTNIVKFFICNPYVLFI